MKMARAEAPSLRDHVASAPAARYFWDRATASCFTNLKCGTSLGGRLADLAGRLVLLATASQLTTAVALVELDGIARRIVIVPPDVEADHFKAAIAAAETDAVVIDDDSQPCPAFDLPVRVTCASSILPMEQHPPARLCTEWVLLTSGTLGVPKMVVHDLASLTEAVAVAEPGRRRSRVGHLL